MTKWSALERVAVRCWHRSRCCLRHSTRCHSPLDPHPFHLAADEVSRVEPRFVAGWRRGEVPRGRELATFEQAAGLCAIELARPGAPRVEAWIG